MSDEPFSCYSMWQECKQKGHCVADRKPLLSKKEARGHHVYCSTARQLEKNGD